MRRSARILVASLCLILCPSVPCFAKEWRGIRPLHTTRSEVIKLLGEPTHLLWGYRDYFILDNEVATFEWIDPACVRKYPVEPDSEVRPEDLVLSISVEMKKPMSWEQLGIPSGKIWAMDCLGNSCVYWEFEGDADISFVEKEDGVTSIGYGATAEDYKAWFGEHKGCSASHDH